MPEFWYQVLAEIMMVILDRIVYWLEGGLVAFREGLDTTTI